MGKRYNQDEQETPVLFRVSDGEVTAVFPTDPATVYGYEMTCYAHVGQHSACSYEWYLTTRAATPAEYRALRAELEGAPFGYRLKIYRRIHTKLRDAFLAERTRLINLRAA